MDGGKSKRRRSLRPDQLTESKGEAKSPQRPAVRAGGGNENSKAELRIIFGRARAELQKTRTSETWRPTFREAANVIFKSFQKVHEDDTLLSATKSFLDHRTEGPLSLKRSTATLCDVILAHLADLKKIHIRSGHRVPSHDRDVRSGTLSVRVLAGHYLRLHGVELDVFRPSPFVVVHVGKHEEVTAPVWRRDNPVWNRMRDQADFVFSLVAEESCRFLQLEAKTKLEDGTTDASLGYTRLDVTSLAANVWHLRRQPLLGGQAREGELEFEVLFEPRKLTMSGVDAVMGHIAAQIAVTSDPEKEQHVKDLQETLSRTKTICNEVARKITSLETLEALAEEDASESSPRGLKYVSMHDRQLPPRHRAPAPRLASIADHHRWEVSVPDSKLAPSGRSPLQLRRQVRPVADPDQVRLSRDPEQAAGPVQEGLAEVSSHWRSEAADSLHSRLARPGRGGEDSAGELARLRRMELPLSPVTDAQAKVMRINALGKSQPTSAPGSPRVESRWQGLRLPHNSSGSRCLPEQEETAPVSRSLGRVMLRMSVLQANDWLLLDHNEQGSLLPPIRQGSKQFQRSLTLGLSLCKSFSPRDEQLDLGGEPAPRTGLLPPMSPTITSSKCRDSEGALESHRGSHFGLKRFSALAALSEAGQEGAGGQDLEQLCISSCKLPVPPTKETLSADVGALELQTAKAMRKTRSQLLLPKVEPELVSIEDADLAEEETEAPVGKKRSDRLRAMSALEREGLFEAIVTEVQEEIEELHNLELMLRPLLQKVLPGDPMSEAAADDLEEFGRKALRRVDTTLQLVERVASLGAARPTMSSPSRPTMPPTDLYEQFASRRPRPKPAESFVRKGISGWIYAPLVVASAAVEKDSEAIQEEEDADVGASRDAHWAKSFNRTWPPPPSRTDFKELAGG